MRLPMFTLFLGLFLASLVSVSAATPASAATIFVDQATGSGVTDGDLDTTRALVEHAVGEVGSHEVTEDEDKADFMLRPTLMKLGESYVLGLTQVRDGRIVHSSQLKAAKMDELDKVATRLTRSVIAQEKAKDNPRVGEITDHEAREGTQRRPTRFVSHFGFGGAILSNLNATSDVGYSFSIGRAWDANVAMIKLVGHGDFSGSAWMLTAGIGGNYFFTMTDIAPYVTADFGAGAAKIDGGGVLSGETVGGFAFGGGAGVQFLRTSSINLDLGFRASVILKENPLGFPQSYALRLGLYF